LQKRHSESSKSNWISPKEIKIEYPDASFLQDNRVVFNIKGNTFRLIARINYSNNIIWIRFIGTAAQYDKVDASKI
jgi:mRNA interferase HigB